MAKLLVNSDASAKVKSLWNGSGNDEPPEGWMNPQFDTSGWDGAVPRDRLNPHRQAIPETLAVWNDQEKAAPGERCIIVQEFDLKGKPNHEPGSATFTYRADDIRRAAYINGTRVGEELTLDHGGLGFDLVADVSALLVSGKNLIAVMVENAAVGKADTSAWASYRLEAEYKPFTAGFAMRLGYKRVRT